MRTHLLVTFPAVLAALPAQAPTRPVDVAPPPAVETAAATDLDRAAQAMLQHVANQPAKTVLFDRPRAGDPLWAIGTAWKASFDSRGSTVIPFFGSDAPRNFPLRVELAAATVGGKPLALADGEPAVTGNTVRTQRGALTEVIDTKLDSLEQSFVFDRLPNRGAIAVDVSMTGEYTATAIGGGLRFANEFGRFDYTKAVALDAAGHSLPLAITWTGTCAHMEIPAAFVEQAQLPIVLDPVLNQWWGIASGQSALQHDSDVASIQASSLGGRTLIVYQRNFSGTDTDCWGVMFDGSLNLVQTDFIVDFTNTNWKKIAVAGNNYAQNFLVVSEVEAGVTWSIVGRTVAANAAVGAVFDIERDGVVGLPGNSFAPDVGSDPYFGVGRYTVVFTKRPNIFSNADRVCFKQVTPAGTLVTTNPIVLETWATGVDKPSISKSCGQSNGPPAWWLITWQRTYNFAPNDQEVYGRYVAWNGAVQGTLNFGIAITANEETAPAAGSPIDVDGARYWPVCYETAPTLGQPRDVTCKLLASNGGQQASFLVNTPVPGEDDKDPRVDSDGTRFVVTRTKRIGSNPSGVEAVTAAYLSATNTFRVDERTSLLTSSLDNYAETNICADYSGGSVISPRYFVSFSEQTSNTFRLQNFGGWVGGSFFTSRSSQCGNLSINVTGSPVIGQSVTATIGNGPLSGTIIGLPGFIPLNVLGCNCWQGVDQGVYLGNPLVWTVPNNPAYVGITLSVQGWTVIGSNCLGFVDLSDTVDFTIR